MEEGRREGDLTTDSAVQANTRVSMWWRSARDRHLSRQSKAADDLPLPSPLTTILSHHDIRCTNFARCAGAPTLFHDLTEEISQFEQPASIVQNKHIERERQCENGEQDARAEGCKIRSAIAPPALPSGLAESHSVCRSCYGVH